MATKRRARKRRTRTTVTTDSASPRRRRRTRLSTSPRRRKRKRGLSEMLPSAKGQYAKYVNPFYKGAIGGGATQLIAKLTPEKMFTDNPSLNPYKKWIKGGAMALGAMVAASMDEPLVAAGLAGGLTVMVMQEEGILQEGPAGSFSQGRFANSRLLAFFKFSTINKH